MAIENDTSIVHTPREDNEEQDSKPKA